MNKFKKMFSFSKKLSNSSGVLLVLLILGTFAWMPSLIKIFFMKTILDCSFFLVVYGGIFGVFYLFIGNRLASKQLITNKLITGICIVLMVILNGIMIYLYSFRILVSIDSLCITIPASMLVTLFCTEIWIQISNKTKNKKFPK
jgi:hypothetical protein